MSIKSKIGILGGGQLGRMLCLAAANWNLDCKVLDVESCPASSVYGQMIIGDIKNYQDVLDFGRTVDVLTIEIENVNIEALEQLQKEGVKIFPNPKVLRLIQDKGLQKQFYKDKSIPSSKFQLFEGKAQLLEFLKIQKTQQKYQNDQSDFKPFVQKARIGGYDGRGVELINSVEDYHKLMDCPCLMEDLVEIDKELAIIITKNSSGTIKTYPVAQMEFDNNTNLVSIVITPAQINPHTEKKAQELAVNIVNHLDYTGILAVEMFLTKSGELLINEIAPRTHNSGHHTIEGSITSQFEQQLRAILDLPPGDTSFQRPSGMLNLVGQHGHSGIFKIEGLQELLSTAEAHLHLYGKKETRPNRKMGHVTLTANTLDELKLSIAQLKSKVKIISTH